MNIVRVLKATVSWKWIPRIEKSRGRWGYQREVTSPLDDWRLVSTTANRDKCN